MDVLEKPRGDEPEGVWEAKLLSTIKLVARIRVITHPRGRLVRLDAPTRPPSAAPSPAPLPPGRVLALGASTGGPSALVQVLRQVPAGLPAPILVVLHIDEPFGAAFAEWLGHQTHHRVAYARDGAALGSLAGHVVLAPPGKHAVVREGRVILTTETPRHSCRPSIDVLFESLAEECRDAVVACLLTGMGRDGAQGLLAIRRRGGPTIAQDESSSVVYGMPREAALLGAAGAILPLSEIGKAAAEAMSQRAKGAP